jgi:hypothetical protein
MIGFHSVIDRPEPVSRVAPPTTTMANTSTAMAKSQTATGADLSLRSEKPMLPCHRPLAAKLRHRPQAAPELPRP